MIRIGVDFGGTKIEAAALDAQGRVQARERAPSPGSYEASLEAVRDLIAAVERGAGVSDASDPRQRPRQCIDARQPAVRRRGGWSRGRGRRSGGQFTSTRWIKRGGMIFSVVFDIEG